MLTMTPIERFQHDPRFYAIVNQMVVMMEEGQCDGATLQHAAVFASIRHGMIHGMSPSIVARQFLNGEQEAST